MREDPLPYRVVCHPWCAIVTISNAPTERSVSWRAPTLESIMNLHRQACINYTTARTCEENLTPELFPQVVHPQGLQWHADPCDVTVSL